MKPKHRHQTITTKPRKQVCVNGTKKKNGCQCGGKCKKVDSGANEGSACLPASLLLPEGTTQKEIEHSTEQAKGWNL